jgi:cytochrome c5
MRTSKILTALLALVLIVVGAQLAISQDKKPETPPMDEKAMMEAWAKANAPTEHHKHMEQMVGTWDCTIHSAMAPGAPETVSKGVWKSHMMFDGRYLHGTFEGEFSGMPFKGMSLMGYDNAKKMHYSLWIDSMSTSMAVSWGTCSDDGQKFEFKGEMTDAMDGKTYKTREVYTFQSATSFTLEAFMEVDGQEWKSMTIEYQKK